jgi:sugar phosphate permease
MFRSTLEKIFINPRKIFFGWWMTIAGGLLCVWGYGYSAYGFSALLKPISEELGFSRTAASFAASITRFEGGLEAPVVGYISDRYGPRGTVFLGIFLAGLGLIIMYFIQSLWAFYLAWSVILCTGTNISLSMPLDVAITNWFIKKRGTALSIKWVFSGLSGVIGMPIVAWLVLTYGWRMACLVGGIVMWVIGLPLVYLFIKPHRPEHYGLLPDGAPVNDMDKERMIEAGTKYAAEAGEVEFTVKEAMKTSAFWLLIVTYMFHGALYPVMSIHCIPFLTDQGMDPLVAAATMSIYITASIPARFLGGVIVDRIKTSRIRFVMAASYFLQFLGVLLVLMDQKSMLALYTFFIIYGLGMGALFTLTPAIRARYFGRGSFGSIAGISRAFTIPVGVLGPVLAGYIYDKTGSYITAFTLFAVLLGIAGIIMSFTAPPKPLKKLDDNAIIPD